MKTTLQTEIKVKDVCDGFVYNEDTIPLSV